MKKPVKRGKKTSKRPSNVAGKKRRTAVRTRKTSKKSRPPRGEHSPRGWSLSTFGAVRRRLAQIISEIDRKRSTELGLSKARTMIYGLSTIAGILRTEQELIMSERILAIEQHLGMGGTKS
ncbi:MAG: hypothetical protein ABSB63_15940 [Spirochaetia bacterium]